MTCHSLEDQLTAFREAYHSVRCWVSADNLVYRCAKGASDRAVIVANNLIEKMGLDLVAVGTTFLSKDSYVIKSIFSEEL